MRIKCAVLAVFFALGLSVGCGGDPAAEANKNLKPVDPNAKNLLKSAGAGGPAQQKASTPP